MIGRSIYGVVVIDGSLYSRFYTVLRQGRKVCEALQSRACSPRKYLNPHPLDLRLLLVASETVL